MEVTSSSCRWLHIILSLFVSSPCLDPFVLWALAPGLPLELGTRPRDCTVEMRAVGFEPAHIDGCAELESNHLTTRLRWPQMELNRSFLNSCDPLR